MVLAELNGSYLKFVDAARLLYEELIKDNRIKTLENFVLIKSLYILMMLSLLY